MLLEFKEFSEEGNLKFEEAVRSAVALNQDTVPDLSDYAEPLSQVQPTKWTGWNDSYSFAKMLLDRFPCTADTYQSTLARNGLWNWLAYSGIRARTLLKSTPSGPALYAVEKYLASPSVLWNDSYRHLIRSKWQAIAIHGVNAQMLLYDDGAKGNILANFGEASENFLSRDYLRECTSLVDLGVRIYRDPRSSKFVPLGAWTNDDRADSVKNLVRDFDRLSVNYDLRSMDVSQVYPMLRAEIRDLRPCLQAPL